MTIYKDGTQETEYLKIPQVIPKDSLGWKPLV